MAAKQLLPNQHVPLHFLYGKDDCCLCKSGSELTAAKEDIKWLLSALRAARHSQKIYDADRIMQLITEKWFY